MSGRTIKQYRSVDLGIFCALLAFFEILLVYMAGRVFKTQFYAVSLTAAISCIVYMRWNTLGLIASSIGGCSWCISNLLFCEPLTGIRAFSLLEFIAIYVIGNAVSAIVVPFMRKLGKERVSKSGWLAMACAAMVQLLMQFGRSTVAVILGLPAAEAVSFITTDSLSLVFSCLVVFASSKADGVFEDQLHYLKRVNSEQTF